jgi:hypothetical protein
MRGGLDSGDMECCVCAFNQDGVVIDANTFMKTALGISV